MEWANRTFDESKHYLRPLPINVISKNPNLIQNPGWE
ncbi:MAG: RagB/SusD family nutrient uptake outer membrane protein [Tannerellaceae bacterium]